MMKKNIVLIVIIAVVVVGLALWLLVFSEGAGTFLGISKDSKKVEEGLNFSDLSLEAQNLIKDATPIRSADKVEWQTNKFYEIAEDNFSTSNLLPEEYVTEKNTPKFNKGDLFVITDRNSKSSLEKIFPELFSTGIVPPGTKSTGWVPMVVSPDSSCSCQVTWTAVWIPMWEAYAYHMNCETLDCHTGCDVHSGGQLYACGCSDYNCGQ